MAKLLLIVLLALPAVFAAPLPPSLLTALSATGHANIAVTLNAPVAPIFAQFQTLSFPVRGQKMTALRKALVDFTTSSQESLRSFLTDLNVPFIPHWITNRVFIRNAPEALIIQLAARPDVLEIREEIIATIEPMNPKLLDEAPRSPKVVRGVHIVRADELWAAGNFGEGTVVSNIDTGVRGTHELLAPNFLGEYGWYDPGSGSSAPNDGNGHGTHTMGTIAGQEGFGVAPGAKWMACMGCGAFGCSESDLIGCGEFIACPHLPDGSNPDCSKAPHVTSNSWGSTAGGDSWYDDVIEGFKAAGVIPVFSAGNAGSGCGSVGSPGDRDVIGVAATDMDDSIAYFSSRGPASDGTQKPDISAPGVEVLSTWNSADDAYSYLSGTSMACPHVSGGVALLIAGNPELAGDYDAVRKVILDNAFQSGLNGDGQTCGGIPDTQFPNNVFGHGRLDLVASSGRINATLH